MIPLRSSESVKSFPWGSVALIALLVLAELFVRVGHSMPFEDAILRYSFRPVFASWQWALKSALVHGSWLGLIVSVIFLWAFTPVLFQRRKAWIAIPVALAGAVAAGFVYAAVFPHSEAPVLLSSGFVSALLGQQLRRGIWSTVNTLVVGPGWIRVYEVPSYVLLFFWFFYLLIVQILRGPPLDLAPMVYLVPLVGLLWGFAADSALKKFDAS